MATKRTTLREFAKEDNHFRVEGLKKLLASYNGRRLLWEWLSICGIFHNPFTTNALQTAYNAGKMEMGQQILQHIIEVDDMAYLKMMQENKDLQTKRREILAQFDGDETDETS